MGNQRVYTHGFTLVELMVSLTIFSITILISVGTLLVMIDANAKAQALYSATTNLSFALDSLTREFRTGYNYYCMDINGATDDDDGIVFDEDDDEQYQSGSECDFIAFTSQRDNKRIGYRLKEGCADEEQRCIEQRVYDPENPSTDTGWISITSRDVEIDSFEVDIENADPYSEGDVLQPVGTVRVQGHVTNGLENDTDFNIQTRIVQRVLDVR